MSNVLERYRNVSNMEFHRNAVWLRGEMERFCMREKNVPRRYRAIITYPLVNAFEELLQLIEAANCIYTDTDEKVRQRKELQTEAIRKVDQIYGILQHAAGLLWKEILRQDESSKNRQRIERAINVFSEALAREEQLLRAWREGTHRVRAR